MYSNLSFPSIFPAPYILGKIEVVFALSNVIAIYIGVIVIYIKGKNTTLSLFFLSFLFFLFFPIFLTGSIFPKLGKIQIYAAPTTTNSTNATAETYSAHTYSYTKGTNQ